MLPEYNAIGNSSNRPKGTTTTSKSSWSDEDDQLLIALVNELGEGNWAEIAKNFQDKVGKQCRERWHNQVKPDIKKRDAWTDEEEQLLIDAHRELGGNKWQQICKRMGTGRSENAVKNHWNATMRRKDVAGVRPSVLKTYLKTIERTTRSKKHLSNNKGRNVDTLWEPKSSTKRPRSAGFQAPPSTPHVEINTNNNDSSVESLYYTTTKGPLLLNIGGGASSGQLASNKHEDSFITPEVPISMGLFSPGTCAAAMEFGRTRQTAPLEELPSIDELSCMDGNGNDVKIKQRRQV